MTKISDTHVPYNTGWAGEMKKGQVIRITATTTVVVRKVSGSGRL